MVAPGQPKLAARLAEQAGKVSHDGESVHAAMLWAAMEAEAFCLERHRPPDRHRAVGHSRGLPDRAADRRHPRLARGNIPDWHDTRQKIEDNYGYDKYPGNCHVVPNHALMVMAVLYAPDDFQRAEMIVNTSGWDTDCNAGNVGCLMGIMLGLDGSRGRARLARPDRRSHADLIGRRRQFHQRCGAHRLLPHQSRPDAGRRPAAAGAQGRRAVSLLAAGQRAGLPGRAGGGEQVRPDRQCRSSRARRALSIAYEALGPGQVAVATTPTFSPREMLDMRTYDLMATPLVYPGQTIRARVVADTKPIAVPSPVRLRLRVYDGRRSSSRDVDGEPVTVAPGEDALLEWRLPDFDGQPIGEDRPGDRGGGTPRRRQDPARLPALGRCARR